MAKNVPNMAKDRKVQIKKGWQTPSRIKTKKTTLIMVKVLKTKERVSKKCENREKQLIKCKRTMYE